MKSRVQLEPAFVLHRRPYRESSLLVEAFGRRSGRVGLVARGARRPGSGLRSALQPFSAVLLSWTGRGELGTLTGAEPEAGARALPGSRLRSGLYVNELMMRLLHRHDPHPELFDSYRMVLAGLADQEREEEPVLRRFEIRLLESVGYGLSLERDVVSGQILEPEALYLYAPESGARRWSPGDAEEGEVRIHGRTLRALAVGDLEDPRSRTEAKRLLRAVLAVHLGGRPLESRRIFAGLEGFPGEEGTPPLRPERVSTGRAPSRDDS
jgi:DNA repair protein RecO (recombination protein O)